MKQKVKYSIYSITITAVVLILFAVGIISLLDNPVKLIFFGVLIGIVVIFGVYYCPTSIEADQSTVTLSRLSGLSKTFVYDDIRSVDTCYPSAGGLKICGSGGFLGYWGYFNDIMLGNYFGYYGSRDQCIIIKLKSGRQYVIGCENSVEMSDYINNRLRPSSLFTES